MIGHRLGRRQIKAIEKCFHRALGVLESSNSEANKFADSGSIFERLKAQIDRCDLRPIKFRQKVTSRGAKTRQEADGFIIHGVPHLKHDRLKRWFPKKSARIALRDGGIFLTQRKDTPTVEKTIGGIKGKPRYYAIDLKKLKRSISTS